MAAIGAPAPAVTAGTPTARPAANVRAAELGWRPRYPDWRAQLGR
jgi:hypothetical protein